MSIRNGDAGFVLTCSVIDSPGRTLVLDAYPSIQGQRYLVLGSMRTLVVIQSRVPGLVVFAANSLRIGGGRGLGGATVAIERPRQAAGGGGPEDLAASPVTFVGHRGPLPSHRTANRYMATDSLQPIGGLGARGESLRGFGRRRIRSLRARAESEGREVFDNFSVELEGLTLDRAVLGGCEPVHLPQVIDRPTRQGLAEGIGRFHRDEAIVWAFNFRHHRMEAPERPANFVRGRISRDRETRNVLQAAQNVRWKRSAALRVTSRHPCGSIFSASSKRYTRPTRNLAKSASDEPRWGVPMVVTLRI